MLLLVSFTFPCQFYACSKATTGGDWNKLVKDVEVSGVYAVIAPQMGKQVGVCDDDSAGLRHNSMCKWRGGEGGGRGVLHQVFLLTTTEPWLFNTCSSSFSVAMQESSKCLFLLVGVLELICQRQFASIGGFATGCSISGSYGTHGRAVSRCFCRLYTAGFLSSFFFSHKAMTSPIVMLALKCFWWEIFSAIL